jgi:hypothetical protein
LPAEQGWRESISSSQLTDTEGTIQSGGLLIFPALFVFTRIDVFSITYCALICASTPHLQSIVHQLCTKVGSFALRSECCLDGKIGTTLIA